MRCSFAYPEAREFLKLVILRRLFHFHGWRIAIELVGRVQKEVTSTNFPYLARGKPHHTLVGPCTLRCCLRGEVTFRWNVSGGPFRVGASWRTKRGHFVLVRVRLVFDPPGVEFLAGCLATRSFALLSASPFLR